MLQLNLDLFLPGNYASAKVKKWREPFAGKNVGMLRDCDTEGYDVIPNFFISATMDPDFDYDNSNLNHRLNDDNEYHNVHFHNRLFDRDTLLLAHYDLNFLFVLKLYAGNDAELRQTWKEDVHKLFRDDIRDLISGRFEFRAIMPHEGIDPEVFFAENFRATLGKVYSPYADLNGRRVYMLAVQKPDYIFDDGTLTAEGTDSLWDQINEENKATIQLLETAFYVTNPVKLGEDPSPILEKMDTELHISHSPSHDRETGVQVVSGVSGGLKNAVDVSGWCPCPEAQCPDPDRVKILVLPHTMGANLYRVIDGSLHKSLSEADLKRLTGDSFATVHFPTAPFHLWRVEKV